MKESNVFAFKSGYTIRAREDYDPRLFQMIMQRWEEDNPPPEPPVVEKQVPVKGGTRTLTQKLYSDPDYLEARNLWQEERSNARLDYLYTNAIDYESIPTRVVEAARRYAEQNNFELSHDDFLVFLSAVLTKSPPGTKYLDTEQGKFHTWLGELGGPSEALIDRFIDSFRASPQESTDLQRVPVAH